MIQKIFLVGTATALAVLFATNLAVHRPEAFFLLWWASAKLWNVEFATRMFETGMESAKNPAPVKDRLRVSDGVALTLSWFDKEAVGILNEEITHAEGEEKKRLDSLRLLALGNARAKEAMAYEGVQKKMQLYWALVAYTWAYSLTSDQDARHNYEIVKNLLDEQVQDEKKEQEEKREREKKEEGSKDEEKNEGEPDEKKDAPKDEKPEESKDEWKEPGAKKPNEPKKSGNWTNGGNPSSLNSDPGGTRWSNGAVPLSPSERAELEAGIRELTELQKNQWAFVRPDGKPSSPGAIPNSLRELFSWDPFFDSLIPQAEQWKNGKTW